MNWTQPLCLGCWRQANPDREPTRLTQEKAEPETCCQCGHITREGIYVRIDPRTVPYPQDGE